MSTIITGLLVALLALPCTALAAAGQQDEQQLQQNEPTAQRAAELPWETTRKPPKLPGRKFENAKELLELLGVDASQWNNLFHNQPLGPNDEERINRILYLAPRVGGENMHRWRKTDWSFADISEAPARHQGEVLLLRGRATRCERVPLVAELADRYEFTHYYRVHLALEDEHQAIVCARYVPLAWTKQEQIDERAEAHGIFLKTSPAEDAPPQLVCASLRVAWLPDRVDESRGVTSTAVLLAERGFDFGLWDLLRGRQKRGLEDADREPFYKLLGAVQKLDPAEGALHDAPPINIAVAITTPEVQTGTLVTVDGTVQRIERVEVSSGDVRAWSGLDHYFNLYVFVPLLKERIALQRNPSDKNPRMFDRHFPVTVCVPDLPSGLQPGPSVHEHVRLQGVFFKVWTYKPQGGPEDNDLLQPSPLIIAPAAILVSDEPAPETAANVLGGVIFLALIGVLGIVLWRFSRSDAAFKRDVLEKRILKEDQVDLSDLEE